MGLVPFRGGDMSDADDTASVAADGIETVHAGVDLDGRNGAAAITRGYGFTLR